MSSATVVPFGEISDRVPSRWLSSRVLAAAWLLNVAVLLTAFLWLYFDASAFGQMERMFDCGSAWLARLQNGVSEPAATSAHFGAALVGLLIGLASALLMSASLFLPQSRFRTVSSWLLLMAVASGWLTLGVTWREVHWKGVEHRVAGNLEQVSKFAAELEANWPTNDGELHQEMAFLAYPKPNPTTLLMLGSPVIPNSNLRFSSVEKSSNNRLRFELAGEEQGAWIESYQGDSPPQTFTSGLESHYEPSLAVTLSPDWRLVRYQATP